MNEEKPFCEACAVRDEFGPEEREPIAWYWDLFHKGIYIIGAWTAFWWTVSKIAGLALKMFQ